MANPLRSTHPPTRAREWVSYESNQGFCVVLDPACRAVPRVARSPGRRATDGVCGKQRGARCGATPGTSPFGVDRVWRVHDRHETQIRRFSYLRSCSTTVSRTTIDVQPPDLRATHAKNSYALTFTEYAVQKHQRALSITIEFERARREGARAAAAHPATRRHHEPILRLPSALAESTLGASGTGGAAAADGGRPGGGSCMSVGGCNGCIGGCGG